MALKKVLQLHESERGYFVGFENYVKTRLTPVTRNGQAVPPSPNAVRKILSGERNSRKCLLDIFQNGTDLMKHPIVCKKVKSAFEAWRKTGEIPESYNWRSK